jgi:hypothetical protein
MVSYPIHDLAARCVRTVMVIQSERKTLSIYVHIYKHVVEQFLEKSANLIIKRPK